MACKRSAVRARLAPLVRSEIRKTRTAIQQESTATAASWAAVRVFGSGMFPGWRCWQHTGFRALNRHWQACHLRESPRHRSRDCCRLVTAWPSWRAISARDGCRICRWSSGAGRPGGPVHSQEPRLPARSARSLTASAARGLGASRRGCQSGARPTGTLRRQARGCAAAQPRAWRRHRAHEDQARCGARDVAERRPPRRLLAAWTVPVPDPPRHHRWLKWRAHCCALCVVPQPLGESGE